MSRNIGATELTALGDPGVKGLFFVKLEFAAGTVYVCNATMNVDWDGHTWLGAGYVGRMGPIVDGLSNEVRGVAMELNGVDVAMVSNAMSPANYFRKAATIWFGPMNEQQQLLTPFVIFKGRMDTMPIAVDGESATIKLTVEPPDVDWDRPREVRYTHAEQIKRYPGDMGLSHIVTIQGREIIWGR